MGDVSWSRSSGAVSAGEEAVATHTPTIANAYARSPISHRLECAGLSEGGIQDTVDHVRRAVQPCSYVFQKQIHWDGQP